MAPVVICKQLKDRGHMTDEDHKLILVMLRYCLKNRFAHPMAVFYLSDGPELIRKMDQQNADWALLVPANNEVLRLIKAGEIPRSALVYGDMIRGCMERYWPDCKSPFYAHARKVMEEARTRLDAGLPVEGVLPEAYREQAKAKMLPDL